MRFEFFILDMKSDLIWLLSNKLSFSLNKYLYSISENELKMINLFCKLISIFS